MKPVQNQWVMSQHVTRCFLMIIFIVVVVFGVSSLKPCLQCVCADISTASFTRAVTADSQGTPCSHRSLTACSTIVTCLYTHRSARHFFYLQLVSRLWHELPVLSVRLRLRPAFHPAHIQPPPLSELPLTEAAGSDVW